LLAEVHKRFEPLKIAPYQGFIQPRLVPVKNGDEIMDVKIEYPEGGGEKKKKGWGRGERKK